MSDQSVRIELKFSNTLSVVSGRPEGIDCYSNQIKETFEKNITVDNVKFIIIFPDCIKLVSASYLLGMFEEINNKIGIEGIRNRFDFEDKTGDELKNMLLNELKRSTC